MSTPISIVGTIATDPRFITTANGVPICSFRVASGERRFDRESNAWVDGDTNWFTVSAFRSLAAHARDSFAKGDRVVVVGRLRVRAWEREERSGISVDIEAEGLGHDLRWGISRFTKRAASEDDGSTRNESSLRGESTGAGGDAWRSPHEESVPDGSPAPSAHLATSGGEPSEDGFVPAAA